MIGDFKRSLRSPGRGEKVEVFTDGNDDYTYAFPSFFKVKALNYAQLVKIRDANGRLIRKEIRIVYGHPDRDEVETVNVENLNKYSTGTSRQACQKDKMHFKKEKPASMCTKRFPVLLGLHLRKLKEA